MVYRINFGNNVNMNRVKNEEGIYNNSGNIVKYYLINSGNIVTYYLINSGHFPWKVQRYSDQIIDEIKKSI